MLADLSAWELVASVGTALGGLAAAASAFFSWQASKASVVTSRDALEALAVGIRPRPSYWFPVETDPTGTRQLAMINNLGEWPATQLEFEARFRDGRVIRDRAERLAPVDRGGEDWKVVLEDPPAGTVEEKVDFAILRYSDDRGIARYESRTKFRYERSVKGSATVESVEVV